MANKLNGEVFSLANGVTKEELEKVRSREKFFCPECGDEVIMKLGNKKIWHFSHTASGSCQYEYDRESEYHLSGKLKLYDWLKKQGIPAELEKFDQQMRQKPDIAFDWNGQKYAIEFQCSVIPADIFDKRTKTYYAHGVIPIWIAAENLIKRKSHMVVSVNQFLYLYLRKHHQAWNIPAFCPISGQLINLFGSIPISTRKTITKLEVKSLRNSSIEDLLNPKSKPFPFIKIWQTENQKLKSRYLMNPGAWQNRFLKELYRNRLSLLTLSPVLGLPVHSSPYIETPSLIWQTYLYLDVFRHHKAGDFIHYAKIKTAFADRINIGDIKLRILPAAGQGDAWVALAEYVFLLTRIGYLEKIDTRTVKMLKVIQFPSSINSQMEAEADFFAEYENKIVQSVFQ
ncbi:competence protein CoiA [Mesobacillus thioparans]|uniref:competence protein CoiA n=1 Tax=Mesobacillus thioparans TaxID=370439 RepID=UPI0039EEF912